MTRFLQVAVVAALLAGCGRGPHPGAANPLILPPDYGTPGAPVQRASTGAECSNAGLERFKGQVATAALGSEMLRVSRAGSVRWVQPGMMVTMEFNPHRLTVHLAGGNVIDRAVCG